MKTIENLNLRSSPNGNVIRVIPKGTVVHVSEQSGGWAHIEEGWVSASYLEIVDGSPWHKPVPDEYFVISQTYLNYDPVLYPRFQHHTGVDYGGRRQTGIPLLACADGEIIYRGIASSAWGASLGNHAAIYTPTVDKSFLYCHMVAESRALGKIKSGEQIGVMGNTGKSSGGAIHLHLEGFHGRFNITWRSFVSLEDIKTKIFDADQFIRNQLESKLRAE